MLNPFRKLSNNPEQQLARLIKQRTDLQSKLHNLRSQLVSDLQDGAELNGQTKAFSEIEQQIQILTEAISECEKAVTLEKQIKEQHAREQRIKAYNIEVDKTHAAAKVVDEAIAQMGDALVSFQKAVGVAIRAGAEFKPVAKHMLVRDVMSISAKIHPAYRDILGFSKNIGEQRTSFTYFAPRKLPEREEITQVVELNNSGWFEVTYSSGFTEKVPKSKLQDLNIPQSKFYPHQPDQSDA